MTLNATASGSSSVATDRLLDALHARGFRVRQYSRDRWRAQCPAHDGQDLNLSIATGDKGVLVKCHSHDCEWGDVAAALGLKRSDMFDRDGRAVYDYGGDYRIFRAETPSGKKIGPERAGITPDVRPLYFPETSQPLADSHTVFLGEGEKTADALARLGVGCAATWAGGAQAVQKTDYGLLAGKHVVIVPDNDAPGMEACDRLRAILAPIAETVKVWRVPAKYDGVALNDAADLWVAGGTLADLKEVLLEPLPEPELAPWSPVDLSQLVDDLVAGTAVRAAPSMLTLSDGAALLYRGKVNGIHGESGCGKTWTALLACLQLIAAGEDVFYVDFEDSPLDVVGRLLSLSARPEDIKSRFHYVQPEVPFAEGAERFLERVSGAALVVIDSTGEASGTEGKQSNSDDEMAEWFATVARPIARQGPGVLVLDHTTKAGDNELYAIGSQRKRAAVSGAQYLQKTVTAFAKDQNGSAKLVCAKDRHGNYRAGQKVAMLQVNAGEQIGMLLEPVERVAEGDFRPTTLMQRVSEFLARSPGSSKRAIREQVHGKEKYISDALQFLVEDGYVSAQPGPRNGFYYTNIRPFTAGTSQDGSTVENDCGPVPGPKRGTGAPVVSPVPGTSRAPVGTGQ